VSRRGGRRAGSGGTGGGAGGPGALSGVPPEGISEVILVVKDVARSVAFYRDVVGLLPERVGSPKFAWFWAGPEGRSQRIGITTGPLSYGAAHCGGPQHFAFGTSKSRISELKAALERAGLDVEGPVEFPAWDAHSIYFSDPDGNRIEFCGFGGGKGSDG
jgi:catechol 2,3-dioxygenase-like lactoylglutathione lyase family enzyme